MRRMSLPRPSTLIRLLALAVIVAGGILALGARCLEVPYVYKDKDGYTHVTGRLYNDTDIQGTGLKLRGTLYGPNGEVLATKEGQPCPPDLQPNSDIAFDLRFDNPSVPPHSSFKVEMIDGRAQGEPLANPDVVLFNAEAIRFEGLPPLPGLPISDDDVLFAFEARNRSGNTYPVQGCAIIIDNQGQVITAVSDELVEIDELGNLRPARLEPSSVPVGVFMIAEDVPSGPVQVKAWLWFGEKGAPTSTYQYVATGLFIIRTETFP